jgi:hypothetical protein
MIRRLAGIALVFVLVSIAWAVLGGSLQYRTYESDARLGREVQGLWGAPQTQASPAVSFHWPEIVEESEVVEAAAGRERQFIKRQKTVWKSAPVILASSKIDVDLQLDQRRKGLLWYSTYGVAFAGKYTYTHEDPREGELVVRYEFPVACANYADFRFAVDGREDPQVTPADEGPTKVVVQRIAVKPGRTVPFEIGYRSRGLDEWRYSFGSGVSRVRNFELTMTTDFAKIDFPSGTISPEAKESNGRGWRLTWRSNNLISGFDVGMDLPRRINPGPLASRIAFFAPVSLGFFFAWVFVIALMRRIELHALNYLFLGAAFFAFHLILSYTVDHLPLIPAFLIASAVSVFLVVSYLRLVVGLRFAALEAGGSQMLYLVLFSYAHFFDGFTGLIVTAGSVVTLFALMQLTGRTRWNEVFARPAPAA